MNNELFQQALENLSEPMIEEAAQIYQCAGYRHRRKRTILRAAAIAAVIAILMTALLWPSEENYITGPGALKVYAHEVDADGNATIESEILEEGVKFTPNVSYNPALSYRKHYPFSFSVDGHFPDDMDITLEVNTNAGIFYKNEPYDSNSPLFDPEISRIEKMLLLYYGQHFTVSIDKELYWEPNGFDFDHVMEEFEKGNLDFNNAHKWHWFASNPSFIDIIIRANDLIVGYCVIEIREKNGMTGYSAQNFSFELLTAVSFPQVDGQWQNVTLKYVQEQINKIHTEREQIK